MCAPSLRLRSRASYMLTICIAFTSRGALARPGDDVAQQQQAADATDAGRASFLLGVAAVKESQWATALDHFERSQAKRKHAVTSYNIGLCQRAVGHYVLARRAFDDALAQNAASGGTQLATETADETRSLLREAERALGHVDIRFEPADAELSIDGRPLTREGNAYVAGLAPEGPPEAVSQEFRRASGAAFAVAMDPGAHTLRVTRSGFAEEVRTVDVAKGQEQSLTLRLRELPGTLRVSSTPSATVYLAAEKLGPSPLVIERPKGTYLVTLKRDGYVAFSSRVVLAPGERKDLVATLLRESTPITRTWWFYAILGGAAAALAVTTYAIVRSSEAPTSDGGSLGWVVKPP